MKYLQREGAESQTYLNELTLSPVTAANGERLANATDTEVGRHRIMGRAAHVSAEGGVHYTAAKSSTPY